jgi:iron(III) transport system permease protein
MSVTCQAFAHSFTLAALVTLAGFVTGWPAGVACGLFRFRLRGLLLAVLALPLLLPSFLWAIGLSMLRMSAGLPDSAPFAGLSGCVWSQAGLTAGLAGFAALLSVRGVSRSQAEAALLAGGHRILWRMSLRAAWPASLAAALLGGVMALSDSGPGLLLGWRTAAGQILEAFAARYDFAEATRMSMALALLALLLAGPLIWRGAALLESALSGRDASKQWQPVACEFGRFTGRWLTVVIALLLIPLLGLLTPAGHGLPLTRAWREVLRTGGSTLIYGAGAGLLATATAWPMAVWSAKNIRRRRVTLALVLALLALPSVLPALAWIRLANAAPAPLDGIFRGHAGVCVVLAWRFLPVAFVLVLRRWSAFSPSWRMAAAVHGVPRWAFFRRVIVPHQAPGWMLAIVLTGLLACSEVGITLLVHPPGEASLPLAIFTVMANAPDTLVAALCLLYVSAILPLAWVALRFSPRR